MMPSLLHFIAHIVHSDHDHPDLLQGLSRDIEHVEHAAKGREERRGEEEEGRGGGEEGRRGGGEEQKGEERGKHFIAHSDHPDLLQDLSKDIEHVEHAAKGREERRGEEEEGRGGGEEEGRRGTEGRGERKDESKKTKDSQRISNTSNTLRKVERREGEKGRGGGEGRRGGGEERNRRERREERRRTKKERGKKEEEFAKNISHVEHAAKGREEERRRGEGDKRRRGEEERRKKKDESRRNREEKEEAFANLIIFISVNTGVVISHLSTLRKGIEEAEREATAAPMSTEHDPFKNVINVSSSFLFLLFFFSFLSFLSLFYICCVQLSLMMH